MTRKDTILIAVVINAGLLAILFTTAVIYDTDKTIVPMELPQQLAESKPQNTVPPQDIAAATPVTGDEVDNVLKYYAPASQPIVVETQPETYAPEPIAVQANAPDEELPIAESEAAKEQFVEVTVKKGDILDKIARANKSSVAAIKKVNNLKSENLSIGQVLKIPVKGKTETVAAVKESPAAEKKEIAQTEAVYHVVKSGDSPWKIAKQYSVNYEDILRLNNLNEEKARNLKIGDKIRVK